MTYITTDEYDMTLLLQGHKKMIWEALATPITQQPRPKSYRELIQVLPSIPPPSLRRCLSEMKRDGYLVHETPQKPNMEFAGQTRRLRNPCYRGRWMRKI